MYIIVYLCLYMHNIYFFIQNIFWVHVSTTLAVFFFLYFFDLINCSNQTNSDEVHLKTDVFLSNEAFSNFEVHLIEKKPVKNFQKKSKGKSKGNVLNLTSSKFNYCFFSGLFLFNKVIIVV